MSLPELRRVIVKAVEDGQFRKSFIANPDKALSGYDLTSGEIQALKAIDTDYMESMAGSVDERMSKAVFVGMWLGAAAATGEAPPTGPGWSGLEEGW